MDCLPARLDAFRGFRKSESLGPVLAHRAYATIDKRLVEASSTVISIGLTTGASGVCLSTIDKGDDDFNGIVKEINRAVAARTPEKFTWTSVTVRRHELVKRSQVDESWKRVNKSWEFPLKHSQPAVIIPLGAGETFPLIVRDKRHRLSMGGVYLTSGTISSGVTFFDAEYDIPKFGSGFIFIFS